MTEQSERQTAALVDPGPVRQKRAYNRKQPIRQEEVRAAPVREEPVRTKKVRIRKNQSQSAPLDIPHDILEVVRQNYGQDLMWGTASINGQPSTRQLNQYTVNAWEPVTAGMFGGILDGLYAAPGHKGEITYDAAVLLCRPFELTLEARSEQRSAALAVRGVQERQLTTGQVEGVDPGILTPKRNTRAERPLTKTWSPIRVPQE